MNGKHRRLYLLTCLLLLVSLLTGCSGGSGGSVLYSVSGKVVDELGTGIDGVEIVVTGGKSTVTTTTDGGTFNVIGLKGLCTLTPGSVDYDFEPTAKDVTKASDDVRFVGTPKPIEKYLLTVELGTGGGEYAKGALVTIKADAPDEFGQVFDRWTSAGGGSFAQEIAEQTSFIMPGNDVTVTASYRAAGMEDYFGFDGTTGTITKYHKSGAYSNLEPMLDPVIPATINGTAVTTLGEKTFQGAQITTVVIPDSVTTIEAWAFNNNLLTSVEIPESVTTIGEYAFCANKLTSITIPGSITRISKGVFWINELTSVTIPTSVTEIGGSAFEDNKLETIGIPPGVREIGESAFCKNNIKALTIPPNVQSIASGAFSSNSNLTTLVIPDNVAIERTAFYSSNLPVETITIGSGVTLGERLLGEDDDFKVVYDGAAGGAGVYIGTFKWELGGREWVKQ